MRAALVASLSLILLAGCSSGTLEENLQRDREESFVSLFEETEETSGRTVTEENTESALEVGIEICNRLEEGYTPRSAISYSYRKMGSLEIDSLLSSQFLSTRVLCPSRHYQLNPPPERESLSNVPRR